MSVLDDTFKYFTTHPLEGQLVWTMDATLTGTKQDSKLPAFVATAGGVTSNVQYTAGIPGTTGATIKFDATIQFQLDPGKSKGVTVTLSADPPLSGGGYSMKIVLPWTTVDCVPNVDASNVVYGSQGPQFVTLVLNPGQETKF